jgi:Uma2 family endonuclease
MAIGVERRTFTYDDLVRLYETGILQEHERVELLDGELLVMSPIGPSHSHVVERLTKLLVTLSGDLGRVRIQDSFRLNEDSVLEPDVMVIRSDAELAARLPGPEDLHLLIEVADSSLRYDRETKLPRYAEAGVPEAWLVIVPERAIIQHTDPSDGHYRQMRRYRIGERVASHTLPQVAIDLADLF